MMNHNQNMLFMRYCCLSLSLWLKDQISGVKTRIDSQKVPCLNQCTVDFKRTQPTSFIILEKPNLFQSSAVQHKVIQYCLDKLLMNINHSPP